MNIRYNAVKYLKITLPAVFLLLTASFVPARANEDVDNSVLMQKGISLSHELGWLPVGRGPAPRFQLPAVEAPRRLIEELSAIRASGFDFIRLVVDPGPFLDHDGRDRAAWDKVLFSRVEAALKADLSVVIDFHPSDLAEELSGQALTRGVDDELFRQYVRMLSRTAEKAAVYPNNRIALELMNEPPVSPGKWLPMLRVAYSAARSAAPKLLLVLDGGGFCGGCSPGLPALAEFADDSNVLFSFHFYDPIQFTHQGAPWGDEVRLLAELRYPGDEVDPLKSLERSLANVEASALDEEQKRSAKIKIRRAINDYYRMRYNKQNIAQSFAEILDWARNKNIPARRLFLGEFGARNNAQNSEDADQDRYIWIRDVREEAEAKGFIWAIWVHRGPGGFALADGSGVSEEALRALGLK